MIEGEVKQKRGLDAQAFVIQIIHHHWRRRPVLFTQQLCQVMSHNHIYSQKSSTK